MPENGTANVTSTIQNTGSAGDAIERSRKEFEKRKRAVHLKYIKQFSFHTPKTFMNYLHGDVPLAEAPMACFYEYGRESKSLRTAAERRDEIIENGLPDFTKNQLTGWKNRSREERSKQAATWVIEEMTTGATRRGPAPWDDYKPDVGDFEMPRYSIEAALILECESFPAKDWNELSADQRRDILSAYETRKTPPLDTPDVGILERLGKKLDSFNLEQTEGEGKLPRPMMKYFGSIYHGLFTIDFSETETHVVERFRALLKLPQFKALFERHWKRNVNPKAKALDRLKDLAAWRLYREFDNDVDAANKFARENRKRRKPFRDAKDKVEELSNGKSEKVPASGTDLFGEQSDAIKAQQGAWKHLVELMPNEFGAPIPLLEMAKDFVEKG